MDCVPAPASVARVKGEGCGYGEYQDRYALQVPGMPAAEYGCSQLRDGSAQRSADRGTLPRCAPRNVPDDASPPERFGCPTGQRVKNHAETQGRLGSEGAEGNRASIKTPRTMGVVRGIIMFDE